MEYKDNRKNILDRKGETVNDDGAGNGKVVEVGYKEARCYNRDTRHFEPEHELLPFEHIEYAVAYRAIDEPENQIKTEIAGKNSRLRPFGAEKSSEYPGPEADDKREGDHADSK